ncbi:autophagy-related protein 20 [[Candida] jaroonii]|uniref:Autophagy-related protein 20 n=1 Tax=[Candida] jaroonii TaxID=467808 RepID=A0ACA9Y484_9ASCO|nr:autophagy-related protein 20 [[Candida] jaroonii]
MDHPFNIEEDNKPSLFSNYDELVNNSITVSDTIQSLLRDEKVQISIKSTEKLIHSSTVVYLIELTNGKDTIIIKRRFSEFKSFRDNLNKLYPSVIIPPIPEKHSIISYFLNSIDNNKEVSLIEFRRRLFNRFLNDLVEIKEPNFLELSFVEKFFDPNYELCWNNALNENPITQLPKNMLLCNPINPLQFNGLYILLPKLNNFNNNMSELYNIKLDNFVSLNDNLVKLERKMSQYDDTKKHKSNQNPSPSNNTFKFIPEDLIKFEIFINKNLKILKNFNKINFNHLNNFKFLLSSLINLGGNLNNFSLEIFELNKELSNLIEKFGSIIDLNYLNYENYLFNHLIPDWKDSINQLILYFEECLNLVNFYKFKIIQFLIIFRLKFNKMNQLYNFKSFDSDFETLKDLNSPSVKNFLNNRSKKSWYKYFGGSKPNLPPSSLTTLNGNSNGNTNQTTNIETSDIRSVSPSINSYNGSSIHGSTTSSPQNSPRKSINSLQASPQRNDIHNKDSKIESIQRDLDKLDQLIDLSSQDLHDLTQELSDNFQQFSKLIEKKWLVIFLEFTRATKQLFIENLNNWNDFKQFFQQSK